MRKLLSYSIGVVLLFTLMFTLSTTLIGPALRGDTTEPALGDTTPGSHVGGDGSRHSR